MTSQGSSRMPIPWWWLKIHHISIYIFESWMCYEMCGELWSVEALLRNEVDNLQCCVKVFFVRNVSWIVGCQGQWDSLPRSFLSKVKKKIYAFFLHFLAVVNSHVCVSYLIILYKIMREKKNKTVQRHPKSVWTQKH